MKRKDAFELIKLLLTRWKQDLPSSYVLDPMNFTRECYTIEESVSDVTQFISDGKSEDFSMIGFICDLLERIKEINDGELIVLLLYLTITIRKYLRRH